MLAQLVETHDVWHIVTGFGTDLEGEFALTAFYAAQTGVTSAAMLLTLGLANTTLFAPDTVTQRVAAIAAGYRSGVSARPLFGIDWTGYWEMPLQQVREQFAIPAAAGIGEGIIVDQIFARRPEMHRAAKSKALARATSEGLG